MKAVATEKSRAPGTVTVKLDPSERKRIAALASLKNRTQHFLLKEAILEYVQREESRQHFIKAAETSFAHYKETGQHITLDEFSTWVDEVQQNPDAPIAACHT